MILSNPSSWPKSVIVMVGMALLMPFITPVLVWLVWPDLWWAGIPLGIIIGYMLATYASLDLEQ